MSEMELLLQQIGGSEWAYAWLPTSAVQALVCWLAATIYRPNGKFNQALAYFSQAQQAIDEQMRQQRIGTQVSPAFIVSEAAQGVLVSRASEHVECLL